MRIAGQTQVIGFFGSTHKISSVYTMYNTAFDTLGLNYVYIPFAVHDLQKAVEGIKNLGIKGVGVTIPYKTEIIKYLDELDLDAKRIGAVNAVISIDGKLIGANTDGKGLILAMKEKTSIVSKNTVILGSGGAARAIACAVKDEGGKVTLLTRTPSIAKDFANTVGINVEQLDMLPKITEHTDIIINATPVGMTPKEEESLISKELLKKDQIVVDIVTKPIKTKLIKDAQEKGCTIILGERMLFYQAVLKFKLFTGIEPPIAVMEHAITNNSMPGNILHTSSPT